MKRTGPTNQYTRELIQDLRRESSQQKVGLWKRIANDIEKPSRQRRVIVPGKVLGSGILNHGLTVAALEFSEKAKKIIEQSKGKAITISELLKQKVKTSEIRIIG